jgi:hypothetical protein
MDYAERRTTNSEDEIGVSLLSFARKPIREAIERGTDHEQIELQMLNTGAPHLKKLEDFVKLDTSKLVVDTNSVSQSQNSRAVTQGEPTVRGQSE